MSGSFKEFPITYTTLNDLEEKNTLENNDLLYLHGTDGKDYSIRGTNVKGSVSVGTTDYNNLTNKPSINGNELIGDTTIDADFVGLGNVDNTSDMDKPISTAVGTALDGKVDKETGKGLSTNDYTTPEKTKLAGIEAGAEVNKVASVNSKTGTVVLSKSDIGLGNVDNTADTDKPISTATQTALDNITDNVALVESNIASIEGDISSINSDITSINSDISSLEGDLSLKEAKANKGAVSGYAPLDGNKLVPTLNLPVGNGPGMLVALGTQALDKEFVYYDGASSKFRAMSLSLGTFLGSFDTFGDLPSTASMNDTAWVQNSDGTNNEGMYQYGSTGWVWLYGGGIDLTPYQLVANLDANAIPSTPSSARYPSTSLVSGELNKKQNTITGGATSIVSSDLTLNRALVSDGNGKVGVSTITSTELGYLIGTTFALQPQINAKQGTITGAASTITSADLMANKALISTATGKVGVSTTSSAEILYLVGTNGNIQTQLNGKQDTISLNQNRAVISSSTGGLTTGATTANQIAYLSTVTSNVQDQLNGKVSKAGDTMTGALTIDSGTPSNNDLVIAGAFSALGGKFNFSDPINVGIEIGRRDGTAGTPYIDLHTDGNPATDYNARILGSSNGIIFQSKDGTGIFRFEGQLFTKTATGVQQEVVSAVTGVNGIVKDISVVTALPGTPVATTLYLIKE